MTPIAATPTSASSPALAQGFLRNGQGDGFEAALDQVAAAPKPAASASASAGAVPPMAPRLTASAFKGQSESEVRAAIHKSAQDFEASSLGQLVEFMTQTIEVDPVFGGGHGEEMFRQMLNSEYGKMMRKTGSGAIAQPVERDLLRAQGLKPLSASGAGSQLSARV